MKRLIYLVSAVIVLSLILSACAGAAGPDATQAPAGTEPPVATDMPTEAPTAVPIDLAGPPMQVGSFYSYFDGSILAAVPGGPFIMGFNNFFDSKEHEVTLSDYWIYTSEVTNEQYAFCVGSGKCTPPDKKDNPAFDNYRFVSYPVSGVTYQQAADYCGFVNGRLPTEAEWEKSARGPEGSLFPWGDAAPACDLLNFNFCKGKAIDVKSYPQGVSYYGLFDMSGNVREWVSDYYRPEYDTSAGASTDPLGPALGQKRSIRSSSFADSADFAYPAHRFSLVPENHLPDLGFRCVVEDPTFYAPFCQGLTLYGSDVNGNPTDDVIPLSGSCEQPGFLTNTDCKKTTDTYVKVVPWPLPAGATLNMPASCVGGPPTWQCSGTDTATIDPQTCNVNPPPAGGTCVFPYVEQPDPSDPSKKICVGQGPGAQCPAGFNIDPLLSCCTAQNPGPQQYGICAPGFYKVGNSCIPSGSNPPGLVQASVSWSPVALCPGTTGGDDTTCTPTCVYDPSTGGQICSGCP